MKHLILKLLFFGLIQNLTAQSKFEKQQLYKVKGDLNCFYKAKYSATQRNQFYPFNIADTIKLVSFRYHRHNYPIKGDSLLIDSLIEVQVLTKANINSLTDILYNNFYKRNPNYGQLAQCFFPRNAILFYDRAGHLRESILLCFQCDRYQKSSDQIKYGSDCSQKMDKLRKFFILCGLKFGTDKSIDQYSGEQFFN